MELRLPSRTEAYNTVKGFLGVPKNALLNRQFFYFFYSESPDGFSEKMTKEQMKNIIEENGIRELNNQYHEAMKAGMPTSHFREEIFSRMRTGIQAKRKPYFVQ